MHTLESPPATARRTDRARAAALVAYQSDALAERYRALVDEVIARETQVFGEPGPPVARGGRGLFPRAGVQGRIRGRAPARRGDLRARSRCSICRRR